MNNNEHEKDYETEDDIGYVFDLTDEERKAVVYLLSIIATLLLMIYFTFTHLF